MKILDCAGEFGQIPDIAVQTQFEVSITVHLRVRIYPKV
jgi:hypothetical protein